MEQKFDGIQERYILLEEELVKKYNNFSIKREEYFKEQCIGGLNFARTFYLMLTKTDNGKIIRKVYDFLNIIVDFPNAGSISWEMRRYLRKAPLDLIEKFIDAVDKIARAENKFHIDMDFYWHDTNNAPEEFIRKRSLELINDLEKRVKQDY